MLKLCLHLLQITIWNEWGKKWNESGFRPPLCTYRLNWARRTSWGWWDDWDDTVLQTQDSKFEPWRSEAEHATSRSRRLPKILSFTRGWGRNIFCFFETAETGNRTPNSGVKGSGANHYPLAPAQRMRYVHQVFLLAGSILKNETIEGLYASNSICQKDEWDASMRNESRQFAYWSLVLDLDMLHCRFVRSVREGHFDLYVQVIDELCGWLFIFDQTHYSRWLPVHVKDMVQLQHNHPEVLQEFRSRGNCVVQKSEERFSPQRSQSWANDWFCKSVSGVANLFHMPQTMDEHVMAGPKLAAADT